jgi:hypothetical protein
VVYKDRTNRGDAAANGWLVPRLALRFDLGAVGSSLLGDQTMAMSAVEGKKAQQGPKAGKAAAPKSAKVPKAKAPKPASEGSGPTGPKRAKDQGKAAPVAGDHRQMWRVLAFVMLGLAAVLLLWAGLDLGHGWSPDGAKGILLRLTPIVCFLLAAAGAITKASVADHAKRVVEARTSEVAAMGAQSDGADPSNGGYVGEQSATSSILGSGYAPAAPLTHAEPRRPVDQPQYNQGPINQPQPQPQPHPQPQLNQSQFNPRPPQFDPGQFNQAPIDHAPPHAPARPDHTGTATTPPTLQPGVAVPDFVSSNPQPDYSGQPPTFDGSVAQPSRVPVAPSDHLAAVVGAAPDARERHPASAADHTVIEIYRNWVLTQTTGERAFQSLDVHDRYDEWFLLSASGVATLLAWTHEDHGATYSAETWVDQILPMQGIGVADRQLALDLLNAAALHAGGLHTAPTQRLMAYPPNELVTAMATVHVGLLRLYSGLEGTDPSKVLREQLGEPVNTQPGLPASPPSDPQARWLPPGS